MPLRCASFDLHSYGSIRSKEPLAVQFRCFLEDSVLPVNYAPPPPAPYGRSDLIVGASFQRRGSRQARAFAARTATAGEEAGSLATLESSGSIGCVSAPSAIKANTVPSARSFFFSSTSCQEGTTIFRAGLSVPYSLLFHTGVSYRIHRNRYGIAFVPIWRIAASLRSRESGVRSVTYSSTH